MIGLNEIENYEGLAFVIVGKTKSGKSTFVKQEFVQRVNDPEKLYIYDINNEYEEGEFEGDWENWIGGIRKVSNSLIVVEEATINMSSRADVREIGETLARKRHQKNVIVFVFHSLHRVPDSIVHFIDGWYIFKTLDNPTKVKAKYADMPHIIEAFHLARSKPKFHYIYTEIPD